MDNSEAKIFAARLGKKIPELDLHGFRISEALEKLELFLYEMEQNKEEIVRVIYGGGTGRLREAVLKHLGGHPLPVEISDEGGSCLILF